MTKREQLARAVLCACADGIVDAILAELREPDENMCDAGQMAWPADMRAQINDAESRAFWQAMIDAIK